MSRSWLYRQPDLRADIDRLRRVATTQAVPIPPAERGSAQSLQQRLNAALDEITRLKTDNHQLRQHLAQHLVTGAKTTSPPRQRHVSHTKPKLRPAPANGHPNTMSASNAPPSDSDDSPTTGSGRCSTPENPTGPSSTPSLPPNIRRARNPCRGALTQVLRSEKLAVELEHVGGEQFRLTLKAADGGAAGAEALFQREHEQVKIN